MTLGRVTEQKIEYYMGVSLETADNALRAQLALPAGRGIVVSDVTSGSPAEKAGIKKHDIVLELGGKHVDSQQTLAGLVQAAKDQPTTLKVLRSGQTTVIPITGAARKVAISAPREDLRAFVVDPVPGAALYRYKLATLQPPVRDLSGTISPDLQVRLDHLEKELKALRESLDKIDAALKAEKAKKRE